MIALNTQEDDYKDTGHSDEYQNLEHFISLPTGGPMVST